MYWAAKVTTTQQSHLQVRLNRAKPAATRGSDNNRLRAEELLEGEMHQVTPIKRKHFDELFQPHECQLFQEVGTMATTPRSTSPDKLTQMETAGQEDVCCAANMTTNNCVDFQVHLSGAGTEDATQCTADMHRSVNQLERVIYGNTVDEQMRCTKILSI